MKSLLVTALWAILLLPAAVLGAPATGQAEKPDPKSEAIIVQAPANFNATESSGLAARQIGVPPVPQIWVTYWYHDYDTAHTRPFIKLSGEGFTLNREVRASIYHYNPTFEADGGNVMALSYAGFRGGSWGWRSPYEGDRVSSSAGADGFGRAKDTATGINSITVWMHMGWFGET